MSFSCFWGRVCKTVMFFALMLFIGLSEVSAQDIIVTRAGNRIEAKVTEVSGSEIRYKEWTNLDGPVFVLSVNEVNTILFQNGSVKLFDKSNVSSQPTASSNSSYSDFNGNASSVKGLPIVKNDDWYYMGDQRMSEAQYFDYIKKNCAEAWESYERGCGLWKAGWIFFGAGSAFIVGGSILVSLSYSAEVIRDAKAGSITTGGAYSPMWIPGVIMLGTGCGMSTASVPCLIVGGIKKYTSHRVYNERCAQTPVASIDFGIKFSNNGIGLAMNF